MSPMNDDKKIQEIREIFGKKGDHIEIAVEQGSLNLVSYCYILLAEIDEMKKVSLQALFDFEDNKEQEE